MIGKNLDSIAPPFYNPNEVIRQRRRTFRQEKVVFFIVFFIFLFIPPAKVSSQEKYVDLRVVADQANIRLEPDISSIIIRQVPKGTILNAIEKKDEWYAVRLMSTQGTVVSGYVHESLVTAIESLPEKKAPPPIPKTRPVEPEENPPLSLSRFTLSISGGGNYAHGGDLNTGIKGLADLYEDSLAIQGKGTIGSVNLGYALAIEVSFPISEMISWGLGAEHFQAKNASRVDYSQGPSSAILEVQPKFYATPLHAFLRLSPIPQLYVKGGISYYFSRCSYTYLAATDVGEQRWRGNANARGLGLMGGIGYVKNHSENLSFFIEITGRLARIKGFTGKEEFQDPSGEISTEKGTLYLIQTQILEERTHPVLFIRNTRPNEAGIIGAQEARIDFSGAALKVGLRLHF